MSESVRSHLFISLQFLETRHVTLAFMSGTALFSASESDVTMPPPFAKATLCSSPVKHAG
jgi:hypothetical protein